MLDKVDALADWFNFEDCPFAVQSFTALLSLLSFFSVVGLLLLPDNLTPWGISNLSANNLRKAKKASLFCGGHFTTGE